MVTTKTSNHWLQVAAALACLILLAVVGRQPARAAGVVGSGTPGSCTEAAFTDALSGGGLVTFNCGPAPHVIILTFPKMIMADTEIDGGGLVELSGGNAVTHFQVFSSTTLTLREITLSRGSGTYGSVENFGTLNIVNSSLVENEASVGGGAIQNYGTLHLQGSVVAENTAGQEGGGLHNDGGVATITDSQVYSNTLNPGDGGGIWNSGVLTVTQSAIYGNGIVDGDGGGIFNEGTLFLQHMTLEGNSARNQSSGGGLNQLAGFVHLEDVTIKDNFAGFIGGGVHILSGNGHADRIYATGNASHYGGAIANRGTLTMTHSLVYSNTAESVAGLYNTGFTQSIGILKLINVTVSENAATDNNFASGVYSDTANGYFELIHSTIVDNTGYGAGRSTSADQLRIQNTMIAGNTLGDCLNSVASNGHNLASDFSCGNLQTGDQRGVDPLLGPLADNGGPTRTYLPQAGSPAIDEGLCLFGIDTDQRGFLRPFGAACDIGAVEVQPRPLYLPLLNGVP